MKARIPNAIQQAARREVERQYNAEMQKFTQAQAKKEVFAANEQLFLDMDAAVLYVLHDSFGFGKERLERFYKAFQETYRQLKDFYLFDDGGDDFCWFANRELKKIGIIVEDLQKQYSGD